MRWLERPKTMFLLAHGCGELAGEVAFGPSCGAPGVMSESHIAKPS